MNEKFIRERITELRIQKNISEYKMSLDLGHSKSYIQSISSGKALPSMSEFLYICEYLDITPKEFFDVNNTETLKLHQSPTLYPISTHSRSGGSQHLNCCLRTGTLMKVNQHR